VSFVTALALGIAIFVAAPLLAHRLRRLRADERPFAAARLVPPAQPRARRRAQLEDRALFGVRALAVITLALLGASPLVRCSRLSLSRSSGASMAVVIVLDDSMSMRAEGRFARARSAASDLLASTRDGDAIGVALAGAPPRVALAPTTDTSAVEAIIAASVPSDRGTDLDGALRIAESLLVSLPQVDKRIVLLSDLAPSDGATEGPPVGESVRLPVWTPLADIARPVSDCALVSADDIGKRVRVHLACGKDASAAGRRIEVRAGDRLVGSATVGASVDVLVDLDKDTPEGDRTAHLLGGDAIASDDVAPVLVASIGGIGVVVEAADETAVTGGSPVVEQALAALRVDLAARPLPSVPDQPIDFSGLLGIIVDDPPGFTPEQRRALDAYLRGGGVMLLALGRRAAAAPLGATLEPLLAHATTWSETKSKGVPTDAPTDLLGEATRSLADVGATHRTVLAPEDVASLDVLLRWSDGAPLVAHKTIERGEVYVTMLPFALDASDLPLRPAFLALLDAFVATTRAHAAPRRSDVGSTWTLPANASRAVGPGGPVELVREGGRVTLSPPLIGAYHVTIGDREELRVAAPVAKEVDIRPRAARAPSDTSRLGATEAQIDISGHVAVALLALMLAEIALRLRARAKQPA
jgi:hypothetical protein